MYFDVVFVDYFKRNCKDRIFLLIIQIVVVFFDFQERRMPKGALDIEVRCLACLTFQQIPFYEYLAGLGERKVLECTRKACIV